MKNESLLPGQRLLGSHNGLPTVELRRYTVEDSAILFEAASESVGAGFTEWMPWCHREYSLRESVDYLSTRNDAWEKGEDFALAVFRPEDGRYLGGAGLNALSKQHGYANLGYWIRRSEWGKGYAVAATLTVAKFAFLQLGLTRVEIVIAVGNKKSCRVAEKAGAKHEGVLRNRLTIGGKAGDAHMYSLIP